MASVAECVIHHDPQVTGHEYDTILIGASHRIFEGNDYFPIKGLDWVHTCYQNATQFGGPGVFWNGISFHPYQGAYGFDSDKFELMAESVRAVARSFGDYDCQIWCSEVGVLYDGWNADTIAKYHQKDAERYLPQMYTTAIASQALPGARYDRCQWWWYSKTDTTSSYGLVGLRDDSPNDSIDTGGYRQVFGSCTTFQTLAEQSTDLRFERRVLLNDTSREEVARIYEFTDPRAEDGRLWVGWAVEPTGRGAANVAVNVPVRTDTVALRSSTGFEQHTLADADGRLRHSVTPRALLVTEVGDVSRPDLRMDSMRCTRSGQVVIRAWVTNHGTRATPVRSGSRVPYPTWNVLRANCDSLAQMVRTTAVAVDQQAESILDLDQSRLPDTVLFSVTVNPSQTCVELGTDDNTGYALMARP
jgi:hypothetical protein